MCVCVRLNVPADIWCVRVCEGVCVLLDTHQDRHIAGERERDGRGQGGGSEMNTGVNVRRLHRVGIQPTQSSTKPKTVRDSARERAREKDKERESKRKGGGKRGREEREGRSEGREGVRE